MRCLFDLSLMYSRPPSVPFLAQFKVGWAWSGLCALYRFIFICLQVAEDDDDDFEDEEDEDA